KWLVIAYSRPYANSLPAPLVVVPVIVPPIPGVTVVGNSHDEVSLEPECDHGLGPQPYRATPGDRLANGAGPSPGPRPNCSAPAAAGDGADNPPDERAAAHVFARALVRSNSLFSATVCVHCLRSRVHAVAPSINHDAFQIQYNIGRGRISHDQ